MSNDNNIHDRDEVLLAFETACPHPSAQDIIEWTRRFPQFAEDIRCYAAISMDIAANEGRPVEEPNEGMLARGYSRALNAAFDAAHAAKLEAKATPHMKTAFPMTLLQIIAASGRTAAAFADEIRIPRSVVADLVHGRIRPPIGKPLIDAFLRLLHIDRASFDFGLKQTMLTPAGGHAKADARPAVTPRSYEEVINDADMSPEQKRFWLSLEEG